MQHWKSTQRFRRNARHSRVFKPLSVKLKSLSLSVAQKEATHILSPSAFLKRFSCTSSALRFLHLFPSSRCVIPCAYSFIRKFPSPFCCCGSKTHWMHHGNAVITYRRISTGIVRWHRRWGRRKQFKHICPSGLSWQFKFEAPSYLLCCFNLFLFLSLSLARRHRTNKKQKIIKLQQLLCPLQTAIECWLLQENLNFYISKASTAEHKKILIKSFVILCIWKSQSKASANCFFYFVLLFIPQRRASRAKWERSTHFFFERRFDGKAQNTFGERREGANLNSSKTTRKVCVE